MLAQLLGLISHTSKYIFCTNHIRSTSDSDAEEDPANSCFETPLKSITWANATPPPLTDEQVLKYLFEDTLSFFNKDLYS